METEVEDWGGWTIDLTAPRRPRGRGIAERLPALVCADAYCPTTLGEVWIGTVCPTPEALAQALAAENAARPGKAR